MEPALVTVGDDLNTVAQFLAPGRTSYSAAKVVESLLSLRPTDVDAESEEEPIYATLNAATQGKRRFSGCPPAFSPLLSLLQVVAVGGFQRHPVDRIELLDLLKRLRREGRCFALEGVQNDSFQQVAQGHFLQFGDGFEHLQQAFFHPHAGLDALDVHRLSMLLILSHDLLSLHWYQGTTVWNFVNLWDFFASDLRRGSRPPPWPDMVRVEVLNESPLGTRLHV